MSFLQHGARVDTKGYLGFRGHAGKTPESIGQDMTDDESKAPWKRSFGNSHCDCDTCGGHRIPVHHRSTRRSEHCPNGARTPKDNGELFATASAAHSDFTQWRNTLHALDLWIYVKTNLDFSAVFRCSFQHAGCRGSFVHADGAR